MRAIMNTEGRSSLRKGVSERYSLSRLWGQWFLEAQKMTSIQRLIHFFRKGLKVKNVVIGCAIFSVLWGVLLFPHGGILRSLTDPQDLVKSGVSLSSYAARPIGHLTVFTGIISPHFGGMSFDPSLQPKTQTTRYYPKPQRVGFQMGTYARVNNCTLQLEVDGLKSEIVSCSQMVDNDIQIFRFRQQIDAGPHLFKLHWEGAQDSTVAVYGYEKDGSLWVPLHGQNEHLSIARVLWRWLRDEPLKASLYIMVTIIAFLSTIFWSTQTLTIVCISLFVGLGLIWRPYSGHDETAHIDMFQSVLVENVPGLSSPELRQEFFNNVHRDMIAGDFYRLHRVSPPVPNTCPHSLLASCGHSDSPRVLYRLYALFLQKIVPPTLYQEPWVLRTAALLFHCCMIAGLMIFCFYIGGSIWLKILTMQLMFYGALIAIFPAITNDVPIMILSMLMTFVFQYIWVEDVSLQKKCALFSLIVILFVMMFSIDPGMISILALLPLLPLVLSGGKNKSLSHPGPQASLKTHLVKKIMVGLCGLGGVVACVIGIRFFLIYSNTLFDYLTHMIDNRFFYLKNIEKFGDLIKTLNMIFIYIKSVLGSYVWGHSYLHDEIYWAGFIFLGLLFFNGFSSLVLAYDKIWSKIGVGICLVLSLSGLVIAIMAAYLAGVDDIPIIRDSFLKSRFTTIGLSSVWIFIGIGLYQIQENFKLRMITHIFTACWGLMLLSYYFPRFFRLDLY
jgi:hypothetical protein